MICFGVYNFDLDMLQMIYINHKVNKWSDPLLFMAEIVWYACLQRKIYKKLQIEEILMTIMMLLLIHGILFIYSDHILYSWLFLLLYLPWLLLFYYYYWILLLSGPRSIKPRILDHDSYMRASLQLLAPITGD